MSISQEEYRTEIQSIAEEAVSAAREYGMDEDDFRTYVHETIDGHQWVIYTGHHYEVLACSPNDGAAADSFGGDGLTDASGNLNTALMAFCAMEQDVWDELHGFDDFDPCDPSANPDDDDDDEGGGRLAMGFPTYEVREMGWGVRCRWVYDETHETRGSYAYETEQETREAEDAEIAALESGELVALGCIVETICRDCGEWRAGDSLWGIVIEPDGAALDAFARHSMEGVPAGPQRMDRVRTIMDENDRRLVLGVLAQALRAAQPGYVCDGPDAEDLAEACAIVVRDGRPY